MRLQISQQLNRLKTVPDQQDLKTDPDFQNSNWLGNSNESQQIHTDRENYQDKPQMKKINLGSINLRASESPQIRSQRQSSKKIIQVNSRHRFQRHSNLRVNGQVQENENYDVFNAPLSNTTHSALLGQYNHIFKISRANIINIQEDIDRILVNKHNKHQDPIGQIKQLLQGLSISVQKLKIMGVELNAHKNDKNDMEKAILVLTLEIQNLKNISNTLILSHSGRLLKSYNYTNVHTKRLANCELYYHHKMKCYKGLGEVFIQLRPHLSQLYLTKYLVSAWKLQSRSDELKAYELLGRFFYYAGNMEKANMYHTRMMEGVYEPEGSGARKLAISKLMNGSIGFKKKLIIPEQEEEGYFNVSSDDEIQEIIFIKEYSDEINPLQSFVKGKIQSHMLRGMPKFDAKNNFRKVVQEFQSGNQNIRIQGNTFYNPSQVSREAKYQITNPNQTIGVVKDIVLMPHLSPSRQLGVYQSLEQQRPCHSRFQNKQLNSCNENWELAKVGRQIQKYTTMLQFMSQWLSQTEFKLKIEQEIKLTPYEKETISPRRRGFQGNLK